MENKNLQQQAKALADNLGTFAKGLAANEEAAKKLDDNTLKALDASHAALNKIAKGNAVTEDIDSDELEEGIFDIVRNTIKSAKSGLKKAGETAGMAIHDAQTVKDVGKNIKQIYNQSKVKKIDQSKNAIYWTYIVTQNGKTKRMKHADAMKLADTDPEALVNAVVIDQEDRIVRRGTEDLRGQRIIYTKARGQVKDSNKYVDLQAKKMSGNPDTWMFIPKTAWDAAGHKIIKVPKNQKFYLTDARKYMLDNGLDYDDFVVLSNNGVAGDPSDKAIRDRIEDFLERTENDMRQSADDGEQKQRKDIQKHAKVDARNAKSQIIFNKISDLLFYERRGKANRLTLVDPRVVSTMSDEGKAKVVVKSRKEVDDAKKRHSKSPEGITFTEFYLGNSKFKNAWDKAVSKQKFESLSRDDDTSMLFEGYSRSRNDMYYDDDIDDDFNSQFM